MISFKNEKGYGLNLIGEGQLKIRSEIQLTIKSFSIFITSNLAVYAHALGVQSSLSYWCPWCLLSCPLWQTQVINQPTGQECTTEF